MKDADLTFVCRVLSVFDGFDGPSERDLWWRTDDEFAPITLFVGCNDLFHWGCADAQEVTRENISLLEQAVADVKALPDNKYEGLYSSAVFCCRARNMRPQAACYNEKYYPIWLWPLFDAAGPVRTDPDGVRKAVAA